MTTSYTLPDLGYDYGALAPHIAGEIMELHHSKHHQTYVNGLNDTLEKLAAAREKGDFGSIVGLEKTLAFNLGGHVNHSIFWKNLSPDGGDKPDGELAAAHRRVVRLVRRLPGPLHRGRDHHPGVRLGHPRLGRARRVSC